MKKWLRRGLLAAVALILLVVVILYFTIDGIIRSRVETLTAESVGQKTTLGGAHLAVFSNQLSLSDMAIANPEGFDQKQFLSFGKVTVTVQPRSLMTDTVQIDDITIDGLHLVLEQSGPRNNMNEILTAVQKQRTQNQAGASDAQAKQLNIGKVVLTNTKFTIRLAPVPGQPAPEVTATLPQLEIVEPTNPDGRLMKFADLTGKILVELAAAAAKDPQLPASVRNAFADTRQLLDKSVKGLMTELEKGGKDLGKALDQTGKDLEKVGKGLEGIFKKKEENK